MLSETITVKELLKRYPHLLYTFIDLRLMCVGCPTDDFHTLADVAREYGLNLNQFLCRLRKDIEEDFRVCKTRFSSPEKKRLRAIP